MIDNIDSWIEGLIESGFFIHDFNLADVTQVAESRFNRYIELMEQVDGSEGPEVVRALAESIQMADDYGAYQVTIDTLLKFLQPGYARCFIDVLAKVIQVRPDLANDLLVSMIQKPENGAFVETLNKELAISGSGAARRVSAFIAAERQAGRLEPDMIALG